MWKALMVIFALLLAPAAVAAQDSDEEAALQKRFKSRDAQIDKLKREGVVGETSDGYLEFVDKKDSGAVRVVNEENKDRKALYKLLAEKEGTTPEKVAERNAKRNFERARPGEYLKQDGKWTRNGE